MRAESLSDSARMYWCCRGYPCALARRDSPEYHQCMTPASASALAGVINHSLAPSP